MKKKVLVKLGGRKHLGEMRWKGALSKFEYIYVICHFTEPDLEIENDSIKVLELPKTNANSKLLGVLNRTNGNRALDLVSWGTIILMRILNKGWLNQIRKLNPDYILCSYGDYDKSDLVCLLASTVIEKPIIRSYKETRVGYSFREKKCLMCAQTIILYDVELKKFLEKKYGTHFFDGKKVLIGYDENALPSCILDNIKYQEKLSKIDGKLHLVILTFRVDSAPNRERDEGRYYYIDIIKELIKHGIVVHLHCAQYNDYHGVNYYKQLADEYPQMFYMEQSLTMKHNSSQEEWVDSCEILSRYDVGLLHNIVDSSSVSEFDRINIPHRFFAYEAAHVIPILKKGENIVLERKFNSEKCGFVYEDFADLPKVLDSHFTYHTPSYEDYLTSIFKLED